MDAHAPAERLAAACAHALGDDLLSAILHGSLALGDFVPGRSDVDLLLIVERPLTVDLVPLLAAEQGRVDVRVVTRAVAAAPPNPPPMELYVGLHPPDEPEIVVRAPEPDLLVELSVCRAHGIALLGAPPQDLIGPVPTTWLLAIGDAQLAAWQQLTDDDPYAELMVLTACRIWRFAVERTHASKADAAAWARDRDPSLDAIDLALCRRRGEAVPIAPAAIARVLSAARTR